MLVLSRKLGEQIVVPDCGLTVTVLKVKGKSVVLGIAAPKEVAIIRREIALERPCPSPDVAHPEQ